jgi:hypothetical protein
MRTGSCAGCKRIRLLVTEYCEICYEAYEIDRGDEI